MEKLTINFYKTLMNSVSDMVFAMKVTNDEEFIYKYLNRAALDGTDYKESIVGKSIHEVNSQEVATFLSERYKEVVYNQTIVTYEDTYVSSQGKTHYSVTTLTPFLDKLHTCTHIIAVVQDITDHIHITRKLEESEQHFQIIAEHAGDLISLINNKGEFIYTSPSYKDMLGFDHKEYLGKLFLHNVYPDDRIRVNKKVTAALKNRRQFTVEFRQYNQENLLIWSESHGSPVFDTNNQLKHMVVITRDISKQKRYEAKLKHVASHDSLTGLPNRRLFKQHLTRALKNCKEKGDGLAVIMLDIDDFKDINDEFGHDIGDEVIEEYGRRVSKSIGEKDTVARLGGDEFVILLPNSTTVDLALEIANNIQQAIRKPWNIKGNVPKVTTSMGITMASAHGTTPSSILKDADVALYEAKNAGRNTYILKE